MTIFLTTQYLEEADKLANRVAIINDGKIVADGTPAELKSAIGQEVITFAFETPELATTAVTVLNSAVEKIQTSGHEVLCYVSQAAQKLPDLLRLLDGAKLKLVNVALAQPTLDDVFLKATGARLNIDAAAGTNTEKKS